MCSRYPRTALRERRLTIGRSKDPFSPVVPSMRVRVSEKKYPALMHGGLNFTAYSKTATSALQDVGALVRAEFAR